MLGLSTQALDGSHVPFGSTAAHDPLGAETPADIGGSPLIRP
ncbi:MAG TPA: hypothetical protein VNL13_07585 [Sulfolobales archaeon]|nr:hypothetical protein [Sulfolobales archaeon]